MDEESLFFSPCDVQNSTKTAIALGEFTVDVCDDLQELSTINKNFFSEGEFGYLYSTTSLLVSSLLSALAIIPYTVYQRQLLAEDWALFCVIRPAMYFLVFFATWHKLFTRKNSHWGTWRIIVNCLFAGTYTTLYTIKWIEADRITIRYLSLPCLCVSWFSVFYEVMDRHLSSRSATSSIDLRRKKAILYAIRQQELACWSVSGFSTFVRNSLLSDHNISVLVCRHRDAQLQSPSAEDVRLGIYENASYDPYERRISSLVDLVIGFSFLPLTLAMVEDYGYPFFRLIRNEDVFLVLIFVFCVVLSCLYLLSTYPIYHGMANKCVELIRHPREAILSFCRRLPLFVLASIVALSRMNSSYSIFGSIIGRMEVPEGMGLALVWFGVATVALVDFSATLKIVSRAVKYIWMITLIELGRWIETGIGWFDSEIHRSVARYHSKRLKRCVWNSDEYDLSCFVGQLL